MHTFTLSRTNAAFATVSLYVSFKEDHTAQLFSEVISPLSQQVCISWSSRLSAGLAVQSLGPAVQHWTAVYQDDGFVCVCTCVCGTGCSHLFPSPITFILQHHATWPLTNIKHSACQMLTPPLFPHVSAMYKPTFNTLCENDLDICNASKIG